MSTPSRRHPSRRSALAIAAVLALLALLITACSSDDTAESPTTEGRDTTATTPATGSPSATTAPADPRPDGPAATVSGPLTGGNGVFVGSAQPAGPALDAAGYVEEEFTVAGTATSYAADELPPDGTYALEEASTADYATRIVVRRPADPAAFNRTVAVEWLNVSGGVDASPDYTYLRDELLREGYAWVGVSAQLIGVEGGPVVVEAPGAEEAGAGKGLKTIDPERYGELSHPGDAFAFDIYTQVARALRDPGDLDPLDGLPAEHLLAVGESQSAFMLTTYYNGVQPLTDAYDGFFVHSRGGSAAPVETPSGYSDIAGSIGGEPTTMRTDLDTPVLVVQTEGDVLGVLGYLPARQADSETVRVWEIAGAAHADLFQVGEEQEAAFDCPSPVNRGQQVFVLRAGLRHLRAWATDATPPPSGEPLEVDESGDEPTFVVDDVGNVRGGVRTPVVDVPVDVLSGQTAPGSSVLCLLFGSTEPIPDDQLAELYDDADDYLAQYTAATDALVEAGFLLADDREAILAGADPSRFD